MALNSTQKAVGSELDSIRIFVQISCGALTLTVVSLIVFVLLALCKKAKVLTRSETGDSAGSEEGAMEAVATYTTFVLEAGDLVQKRKEYSDQIQVLEKRLKAWILSSPSHNSNESSVSFVECEGTMLGQGAYGKVTAGRLVGASGGDQEVAVKVYKRLSNVSTIEQPLSTLLKKLAILQECEKLLKLSGHPNILKFLGITMDEQLRPGLVTERMDCSVDKYLASETVQEEGWLLNVAIGTARGLAHIHSLNMLHRDISCRNVFLKLAGIVVKLGDLGLGREVRVEASHHSVSADWRLPLNQLPNECFDAEPKYYSESDIWQFGLFLVELFNAGRAPISCESTLIDMKLLFQQQWASPEEAVIPHGFWEAIPSRIRQMLSQVLKKYRKERKLSAAQMARQLECIKAA